MMNTVPPNDLLNQGFESWSLVHTQMDPDSPFHRETGQVESSLCHSSKPCSNIHVKTETSDELDSVYGKENHTIPGMTGSCDQTDNVDLNDLCIKTEPDDSEKEILMTGSCHQGDMALSNVIEPSDEQIAKTCGNKIKTEPIDDDCEETETKIKTEPPDFDCENVEEHVSIGPYDHIWPDQPGNLGSGPCESIATETYDRIKLEPRDWEHVPDFLGSSFDSVRFGSDQVAGSYVGDSNNGIKPDKPLCVITNTRTIGPMCHTTQDFDNMKTENDVRYWMDGSGYLMDGGRGEFDPLHGGAVKVEPDTEEEEENDLSGVINGCVARDKVSMK
jgi:hypothetical protein